MGLRPVWPVSFQGEMRSQAWTEERAVNTRGEGSHLQAEERGLGRNSPARVSDLQPPGHEEMNFSLVLCSGGPRTAQLRRSLPAST